jgi:hypothetical protein
MIKRIDCALLILYVFTSQSLTLILPLIMRQYLEYSYLCVHRLILILLVDH